MSEREQGDSEPGQRIAPPHIPVFLNPNARGVERARQALEQDGGFEIRECAPGDLEALVRSTATAGATRVAVVGGDGTVACAAAAVANSPVELAVIPAGTLNHVARDLGLPLDAPASVEIAKSQHTSRVDAGFVNGVMFLNTSSVGAYVTFVRVRNRMEKWLGYRLASLMAAIRIVVRLRTFRVTLELNGVSREYITPLVFIGVGERELKLPSLGARVHGGGHGLHVMVVRSRTGARILALAMAAAARGISAVARTPSMDAFLVDACTVHADVHSVAIDGEVRRVSTPLQYRLASGVVTVVVPGDSAGVQLRG